MKFSKVSLRLAEEKTCNYNSRIIKETTDVIKFINETEEMYNYVEERMLLICLNTKNQIIAYSEIARGGIDNCNVDIKSIFKTVLMCNASKFILIHNHPSGNAMPSNLDFKITERILKASQIMDIKFLDHVVVGGKENYASCLAKYMNV